MSSGILAALGELMEARKEKERKIQEIRRKVIASGVDPNEWERLAMFRDTFNDQAGALAFYLTTATKTGDKEIAELGMKVAAFMSKTATRTEAVLAQAGVNNSELGLLGDLADFRRRMAIAVKLFMRVMAGEDMSKLTANQMMNGA
jgi:hypothetical protein